MTIQFSTPIRNARLDAVESIVGTSAVLKVFSGAQPANPAAANSGTVLATAALATDWMAAASAGAKGKLGTWQDTAADASGTPGHFRIYASDGVTCGMQGSCSFTGGGGDMTFDSSTFTAGQQVTVTNFDLTEGNA